MWGLLLFINDIPTIEDFNVETIKVPSHEAIMNLTNAASERKTLKEIVPLYDKPLSATAPLFSKRKVTPKMNMSTVDVPVFAPNNIYFMREVFTLGIVDVRNRYIDLSDEPINESVTIQVLGDVNYLKDKHYGLIRGKLGNNRFTWDPRRLSTGVGMLSTMVEGTQFEISYARKNPS